MHRAHIQKRAVRRRDLMRRILFTLALPALICSCGWPIKTPNGFAVLENPRPFAYHAVSDDGCHIAVEHMKGAEGADLRYWANSLKRQLVEIRGYKLVEETGFTTESGSDGRLLVTRADYGGRAQTFLVALVMDGEDVWVLKAVGPEETMKEKRSVILAAFKTVD